MTQDIGIFRGPDISIWDATKEYLNSWAQGLRGSSPTLEAMAFSLREALKDPDIRQDIMDNIVGVPALSFVTEEEAFHLIWPKIENELKSRERVPPTTTESFNETVARVGRGLEGGSPRRSDSLTPDSEEWYGLEKTSPVQELASYLANRSGEMSAPRKPVAPSVTPPTSTGKNTDVGSGQTDVGSGQTETGTLAASFKPSTITPEDTEYWNAPIDNLDWMRPTHPEVGYDFSAQADKDYIYSKMNPDGGGTQPVETGVSDDGSWYSGITDWGKENPGWVLQGLGALLALAGNDPRQKLEDARMARGRELIGNIPEYTPQEMTLTDPYPTYAAHGAIAMQDGGVANPDSSEKSILGKFLDLFLMSRPEKTMEEVVPGMTGKPYGAQNKTLQEYKDLHLLYGGGWNQYLNQNHDAHVERWKQWQNIENQMMEEMRESRKQNMKRSLMDMLDQHIEGEAKPFAHGGVAGQAYMGGPTQGLVGEAGPEWVGPLNQSPVKGTALADLLNIPTRRFANGGVAGDLTKSNYDPNQNIGMPDLTPKINSPPVTPAPVQNQTPYWQGIHEGIRETQQGLGRGTPSDVSFQRAVAPYYMQQHQADRQFGLQERQLGQTDMNNAWQRIMDQNRFRELQRQFAQTSALQGLALETDLSIPQYRGADFVTSLGQGVGGLGQAYNYWDYANRNRYPWETN